MAILRARGEVVRHTESVQLTASFRGTDGNLIDLPNFPTISITEPSGNVLFPPTSAGVYHTGIGSYAFDYHVGLVDPIGVYADFWTGSLDGYNFINGVFNFVVMDTQLPQVPSDGYESLGQDVGFEYSSVAIHNINKILKAVKVRLKSSGKATSTDDFGNRIFVDCDVFSVDMLVTFIAQSLTAFNELPHFTFFTFDDTQIIDQFFDILVQGAVIWALASQALIERGREFTLTDTGTSVTIPLVSELLETQYSLELAQHFEKCKYIKAHMKPSPLGVGSVSVGTSRIPLLERLSRLRERRLF